MASSDKVLIREVGADPEEGTSYRPLYYTQGDLDTARNMYQIAADHVAQLLAAE